MTRESAVVYVQESEPSGYLETDPLLSNAIWIKPSTGQIYEYNEGTEGWDACPTPTHTHEGLDQLPDIITLLSGGITGSRTFAGYTLTFNHGVLVGFEQE